MASFLMAFESTHAAMAAHASLSDINIAHAMIPTPRFITAGCGMTLRFEASSNEEAVACAFGVKEAHGLASLYREDEGGVVLLSAL